MSYDIILVNTSAGKDSQAMMDEIVVQAESLGIRDRLVAAHADLGRVEWPGTAELARLQAEQYYHLRFEIVSRPQGDLLTHIEQRGMFPDNANRYCTSDHKRGQVTKIITALVAERRNEAGWVRNADGTYEKRQVRILNCMGFRRQESPARKKKVPFSHDVRASNGRRHVDTWYPILEWTIEDVWARIKASGVPHHPAYDSGMPRLSCSFCVLASKGALIRAAQLRPELAEEYRQVEVRIGHRFRNDLSMAQIIDEAKATETVEIGDWAA